VLLIVPGLHIPVIALVDVLGNIGATDPLHIGDSVEKDGTTVPELTVSTNVAVVAHWPAVGTKV
jgi:hypothetical protein